MYKIISYKGIKFDWWQRGEGGLVFSEICHECAEKAPPEIKIDLDDGNAACGCCGVLGCTNSGNNAEVLHYYIDFDGSQTEYEEEKIELDQI